MGNARLQRIPMRCCQIFKNVQRFYGGKTTRATLTLVRQDQGIKMERQRVSTSQTSTLFSVVHTAFPHYRFFRVLVSWHTVYVESFR